MTPFIMIGSGLVALVAVAGWLVEARLRASIEAESREIEFDRDDAWDEVAFLHAARDAAARKRSASAKHARACQMEQERARTEATRLAIEASARKVA